MEQKNAFKSGSPRTSRQLIRPLIQLLITLGGMKGGICADNANMCLEKNTGGAQNAGLQNMDG